MHFANILFNLEYKTVTLKQSLDHSYFVRRKDSLLLPEFTGMIGGNGEKVKRRRLFTV